MLSRSEVVNQTDLVLSIDNSSQNCTFDGRYWNLHLVLCHRGNNCQQKHYSHSFPKIFQPSENFRVRLYDIGSLVSESTLDVNLVFSAHPESGGVSASEKTLTCLNIHTLDFLTVGQIQNWCQFDLE